MILSAVTAPLLVAEAAHDARQKWSGIVPERSLNNGQPWLHAMLIAAAAPWPGEHVVHIGAGVGYYTAILAHLVGDTERVTAIEFDGGLAVLAVNFAGQPSLRALQGDGAHIAFDPADVICVERRRDPAGRHLARPAQR